MIDVGTHHLGGRSQCISWWIDRFVKMADIKESPPLFDTSETKVDDLDDDDEDIFASAVQVFVFYCYLTCA